MKGKTRREFVDTNILVYAYDVSAGTKHEIARSLVLSLWEKGNGCLSIQVLQEFYVTMLLKVRNPLPSNVILNIISDLSSWKLHSPRAEDVVEAITLHQTHRLSFWDAMVLQSARCLHCSILWSEDMNNGALFEGIKVLNPFVPYSDSDKP